MPSCSVRTTEVCSLQVSLAVSYRTPLRALPKQCEIHCLTRIVLQFGMMCMQVESLPVICSLKNGPLRPQ